MDITPSRPLGIYFRPIAKIIFVTLNAKSGVVIGSRLRRTARVIVRRVVEILFANVFSSGRAGGQGGQDTEILVVKGRNFEGIV